VKIGEAIPLGSVNKKNKNRRIIRKFGSLNFSSCKLGINGRIRSKNDSKNEQRAIIIAYKSM